MPNLPFEFKVDSISAAICSGCHSITVYIGKGIMGGLADCGVVSEDDHICGAGLFAISLDDGNSKLADILEYVSEQLRK